VTGEVSTTVQAEGSTVSRNQVSLKLQRIGEQSARPEAVRSLVARYGTLRRTGSLLTLDAKGPDADNRREQDLIRRYGTDPTRRIAKAIANDTGAEDSLRALLCRRPSLCLRVAQDLSARQMPLPELRVAAAALAAAEHSRAQETLTAERIGQ
jgi:hypothetical protein